MSKDFDPNKVERLRFWQCDQQDEDWRRSTNKSGLNKPQYVKSSDYDQLLDLYHEARNVAIDEVRQLLRYGKPYADFLALYSPPIIII